MTLYIVSFDTRYHVVTVESSQLKRMGTAHANKLDDTYTLYKPGAGHYGYIWKLSQIFTTNEGAHAYINKDYITAYKNQWKGNIMTKELYNELKQIEERLFYIANEFGELFEGELSDAWSSLYSYLEKIEVNELE